MQKKDNQKIKGDEILDRNSYLILAILRKCKTLHPIRGLTVNEIAEEEKSANPIRFIKR